VTILDEGIDEALALWCKAHFGVSPNHLFNSSEIQGIIGDSQLKWASRVGSLGRAYPGHRIAILNEDGSLAQPEQVGEIALHRNDPHGAEDPALPLRYWRTLDAAETNPDQNGWWRSGELGRIDAEGFFWHSGRKNRIPAKNKTVQPALTATPADSAAPALLDHVVPQATIATVTPTE
jgi:acetyl-CoA synthetase